MTSSFLPISAILLLSILYFHSIDCCGNVQQSSTATTASPGVTQKNKRSVEYGLLELSTTLEYNHKGIQSIEKIETIAKSLNIDFDKENIQSILIKNQNGFIGLSYELVNIQCQKIITFAQTIKDTVSFVKNGMVECENDVTNI